MRKPIPSFSLFLAVPCISYAKDIPFLTGHLSNRLTYYIYQNIHANNHVFLDFVVKAGSLDESDEKRGFSYLEYYIQGLREQLASRK